MKKIFRVLIFFSSLPLLFLFVFAFCVVAQEDVNRRSITSDDFANKRPVSKVKTSTTNKVSNRKPVRITRPTYKFVRVDKSVIKKTIEPSKKYNSAAKNKNSGFNPKTVDIGFTIWKLRAPNVSEAGVTIPILDSDGNKKMWLAERVNQDKSFEPGDRIRIGIESSSVGYLYVINREIYSDGSFGDPILIFPSLNENNFVKPGFLVDIPDHNEDLPYFIINPKKSNYAGELLTVIVSPKPTRLLETSNDGKIENLNALTDLEVYSETEIYARMDSQDKLLSQSEAEASCGAKSRQQNSRQLDRPCGSKTRQLTREDPLPQMIYRIKAIPGIPVVGFVKIKVKK